MKLFMTEIATSHTGVGAVFFQEHEGGKQPLAYSKGINPTEKNINYSMNCN